jgi:hypothetical protein
MTYKLWMFFFALLVVFNVFAAIGDSSFGTSTDGSFLNTILGFQIDKLSQGAGFIGVPRAIVAFFTTTIPHAVTFNYNFLTNGPFTIIRWLLAGAVGAPTVITTILSLAGIVQVNH